MTKKIKPPINLNAKKLIYQAICNADAVDSEGYLWSGSYTDYAIELLSKYFLISKKEILIIYKNEHEKWRKSLRKSIKNEK